jgi:hypothetical protein
MIPDSHKINNNEQMKITCKIFNSVLVVLIWYLASASSLSAQKCEPYKNYGSISFHFINQVKDSAALFDTMIYKNSAGNKFEINKVQYFVSEFILYKNGGVPVLLSSGSPWHYVDKDYPKTLEWKPADNLSAGKYDSVSFTFGLSKEINKSFMFKNPPESIMFWPEVLGGGYHYMKINVRYLNNDGDISNFNCHLGIGRIKNKEGNSDNYIHNAFRVTLPVSSFILKEGELKRIMIIMDIEKLFGPPNIINFNNYGGIMDNQEAMSSICKNGSFAFSCRIIE